MPHIIRLRGPWNYQPVARLLASKSIENLPRGGTTDLQAAWSDIVGSDFVGTVRFTRRFHRPTGLTAESKVWLVIDGLEGAASIALNDIELGRIADFSVGPIRPARFDISARLLPDNVLALDVRNTCAESSARSGPIASVRLEID